MSPTYSTRADIAKSGAQSMADLLDYATSITVGRSGALGTSAFVRIRGVPSSNQVQVLIDDQPIGTGEPGPIWRKLLDAYREHVAHEISQTKA